MNNTTSFGFSYLITDSLFSIKNVDKDGKMRWVVKVMADKSIVFNPDISLDDIKEAIRMLLNDMIEKGTIHE